MPCDKSTTTICCCSMPARAQVIVHPDRAGSRALSPVPARPGCATPNSCRCSSTNARVTRDGVEIQLFANAELPADIAQARNCGAAGVGLYRTEFLFLQRHELPSRRRTVPRLSRHRARHGRRTGDDPHARSRRRQSRRHRSGAARGIQSRARRARRASGHATSRRCSRRRCARSCAHRATAQVRMLVPMVTDRRGNRRRARADRTNARATCAPKATRSPTTSNSAR